MLSVLSFRGAYQACCMAKRSKGGLALAPDIFGLSRKNYKRCLFVHDGIFGPRSRKRISAVGCRIDVTGERSVGKRSDLSPSHSCLGVE